jgi:Arc/MetJ-type ribon-helix-helix transcriptional regulator
MSQQIAIRLDEDDLAALDEAVAAGRYPSRAAAVRAGVRELVREQRNREIAAEYRRAYGETPQEPWFADASARAAGELLAERTPSTERTPSR